MWLKIFLSTWLICFLSLKADSQVLTYSFTDPCTKQVTFFSVPATGTTIFFLGQSSQFTSADVASGAFGNWINQVYSDYRKISPCGVQSGQVNQNLITSQIIGSTVQSVVSSIMASATSVAGGTTGGNLNASNNNKDGDKKPKQNGNNNNTSNSNNSNSSSSNSNIGGTTPNSSNNQNSQGNTTGNNGNGSNNNTGNNSSSSNNNANASSNSGSDKKTEEKGEEVAATTTMNVDARQDKGSESGGGGKGGGKSSNARSNPIIVQSDLTTAQNLDKSFTPILNLGMSQSSMTGMSSWGLTSMTWLNFKQFALSGRYTKIHFSGNGKLKFVHNLNLTGVYTYGNILAFVGYSGILNAGKWGITGFNVSAAGTIVAEEDNTYFSPSITAFYTRPFTAGKRLTISPELYIISTPLIYSSKERITTTDRTFSGFLGSGFDYQITKRFKFNINYKANLSTNPDFPILSFFLIGSKVNL